MSRYTVERSTIVQAPPEVVHHLVHDFHEWPAWSPWEDLDPDLRRTYSGPDHGVGARYEWSGNRKAGAGSMQITESTASVVAWDLEFQKPFRSRSRQRMTLESTTGVGTRVTWHMDGEASGLSGLMGRFLNFEKIVGPDFEKGLGRLKTAAEERA